MTLVASVNGSLVEGESKIPMSNAPITQVFLRGAADLNPGRPLRSSTPS